MQLTVTNGKVESASHKSRNETTADRARNANRHAKPVDIQNNFANRYGTIGRFAEK